MSAQRGYAWRRLPCGHAIVRRGGVAGVGGAVRAGEYHGGDTMNTYIAKRAGGREERFCRECCRERDRVRYARKVGRRETA